ncbi:unnamed protein product, partial [Prorocentrum cordatum]
VQLTAQPHGSTTVGIDVLISHVMGDAIVETEPLGDVLSDGALSAIESEDSGTGDEETISVFDASEADTPGLRPDVLGGSSRQPRASTPDRGPRPCERLASFLRSPAGFRERVGARSGPRAMETPAARRRRQRAAAAARAASPSAAGAAAARGLPRASAQGGPAAASAVAAAADADVRAAAAPGAAGAASAVAVAAAAGAAVADGVPVP